MFIKITDPYTGQEKVLVSQHTTNGWVYWPDRLLPHHLGKKYSPRGGYSPFSRKAKGKSPQRGELRTLKAWETGLRLGTQEVQK